MNRRIKGRADMVLYWICTAVLVALISLLGVYLSGCGGEKAPPNLADFVAADVLSRMVIVEDNDSTACTIARKQLPTVRAITICNRVYICDASLGRVAKTCILAHEAHHVEQNGGNYSTCVANLYKYGLDYYIGRAILAKSGRGAYTDIEEEREARAREADCLGSF